MQTVGVISLGCSKNRVDTEYLLGFLRGEGFQIVQKAEEAEVLIVNTCGFITPAKEESISTILEMAQYKTEGSCKLLAVTGCLSQRYPDELIKELPEVDVFWGVKDYRAFASKLAALAGVQKPNTRDMGRVLTTPSYSAYLRVADGCDNRCTYCAIPLIRGGRNSVAMEELLSEARALAANGVKELTAIAQDTSAYGTDLYGRPMLKELLQELSKTDGLHWVRTLYAYPNTIDEALINEIIENPKLTEYLDIPVQHISEPMLRAMNRHGSRAHIERILKYIRSASPEFILRTTVMVGFPGETEDDFKQLYDFLGEHPFDRLGAFIFSPEEGTPAATYLRQVDEHTAQKRLEAVMTLQRDISLKRNEARVGKTYEVLIERVEGDRAWGRSYAEAPEVDGLIALVLCEGGTKVEAGGFTRVLVTKASHYDLEGEQA